MIQYVFQDFPQIIAGTTTRNYGNCSNTLVEQGVTPLFHQILLDKFNMDKIYVGKLIHTDTILNIAKEDPFQEADALITNITNTLIGVTTADCIPVFIYDPINQATGIVHSGRKGVHLQITNKTIHRMIQDFESNLSNIYIHIGPHICKQCYEVDSNILEEFNLHSSQKKGYLPMQDILLDQLLSLNIPRKNIQANSDCTLCDKKYFSHRRHEAQRMLSFIGIRSS